MNTSKIYNLFAAVFTYWGVTIYCATIYLKTKIQQYVSWIVTICIVDSSPKIKNTVRKK